MPKVDAPENTTPEAFIAYQKLGIHINYKGGKDGTADCPFCGKEGKLSIKADTGQYRCVRCDASGNRETFMEAYFDLLELPTAEELEELRTEKNILSYRTLIQWGVRINYGQPILASHTAAWLIRSLYVWKPSGKKYIWQCLKGMHAGLYGPTAIDPTAKTIYICEGAWDGMALSEIVDDGEVVAVPGCSSFTPSWASLFGGKRVVILYDSDYPIGGKPAVGFHGVTTAASTLATSSNPPSEILYLRWGPDGYDPDKPSGWDLRDALTEHGLGKTHRLKAWEALQDRIIPLEQKHLPARTKPGTITIHAERCESYPELVTAWRKAMAWSEGLDYGLASMLAAVVSTATLGDQLWLRVISPPSSGKSTLCEALSVNPRWVLAKSTLRGFHSGFGEDGEDNSLVSKVSGKTLITKDGDTLLQSPNLPQILSEARDVYDKTSRTSYRNRNSRDYHGIQMTWLLCGTSSLRTLDKSELGERFLDVVLMEEIDSDAEDEILLRVAHRASRNAGQRAGKDPAQQQDEALSHAMALTGGFVDFLRENDELLISQVELTDDHLLTCARLGKFVACMRAKPDEKRRDGSAEREFGARLTSQLTRYLKCLCAVYRLKQPNETAIQRTRRAALDTARGQTLQIVRRLLEEPANIKQTAHALDCSFIKAQELLKFMKKLKLVESFTIEGQAGSFFKLTENFAALCSKIKL